MFLALESLRRSLLWLSTVQHRHSAAWPRYRSASDHSLNQVGGAARQVSHPAARPGSTASLPAEAGPRPQRRVKCSKSLAGNASIAWGDDPASSPITDLSR